MTDDRIKGVWLASHPIYYTKKGESNVKNEFKVGDLVFEVSHSDGIFLTRLAETAQDTYELRGQVMCYLHDGRYITCAALPSLFHATPEMREKLVAIWGEDAVPELPLRGSELTKKLLERQKYVLCLVSHVSDDNARRFNPPKLHIVTGVEGDYFNTLGGISADFAVPVDMNGNEIMDYEE